MFCLVYTCPHTCTPTRVQARWFTTADEALGVPVPPQHSNQSCQQGPWRTGGIRKYLHGFPPHHDLCVCGDEMVWVHISFFSEGVCGKCLKRCAKPYQLAMWEIGGTPAQPDSTSPPLLGRYISGNIRLWMHGGRRLVYFLTNLGSWVAFSMIQPGRLTVGAGPRSRCILYNPC